MSTRPLRYVDPTIPPILEYPRPFKILPVVTERVTNAPFSNLPAIPPAVWLLLRAAVEMTASTFDLSTLAFPPVNLPTIPPA